MFLQTNRETTGLSTGKVRKRFYAASMMKQKSVKAGVGIKTGDAEGRGREEED